MGFREIKFEVKSFEKFVLSVLRQIATLSQKEICIGASFKSTWKKGFENNEVYFDAFAPNGFENIKGPVVFEIKYAKSREGVLSSLNNAIKKIMKTDIPLNATLVIVTNGALDGNANVNALSTKAKHDVQIFDIDVVEQWIERFPVDYANVVSISTSSIDLVGTSSLQESDFDEKRRNNLDMLHKTLVSDENVAFVLGAGVSAELGAKS